MALPPPGYPLVTRVISNPLFPSEPIAGSGVSREDPVTWMLGQPHPFVPTMTIVRMFVVRSGGVEIYSVGGSPGSPPDGMRNLLPMHSVRFVEEAMPIEVFIDELALAESGDDDEPEPEPEPQGLPGDPADPANGQAGSALT